jgi:xanthine/CO dehydrogenase XdhC/CoxF family maturation factor
MGYLGMIGSKKKVLNVFDELSKRGISREVLASVRAPSGSISELILRRKSRSACWPR